MSYLGEMHIWTFLASNIIHIYRNKSYQGWVLFFIISSQLLNYFTFFSQLIIFLEWHIINIMRIAKYLALALVEHHI